LGGDCAEDISTNLKDELESFPKVVGELRKIQKPDHSQKL
jgi:hypothetical protein